MGDVQRRLVLCRSGACQFAQPEFARKFFRTNNFPIDDGNRPCFSDSTTFRSGAGAESPAGIGVVMRRCDSLIHSNTLDPDLTWSWVWVVWYVGMSFFSTESSLPPLALLRSTARLTI